MAVLSVFRRILCSTFCNRAEAGVVFITTLLLLVLLLTLSGSGLFLGRADLQISYNLLTSTQAVWLARAGTEIGKNWLETNLPSTPLPVTLGPQALADGTYTVSITALGNAEYRLRAVGMGAEASRHVVEEIVHVPNFTPTGVVTSDGDGLHPDFDDTSGGTGHRIPDFSVDGRNHALDGTLSSMCPDTSPFATTQVGAQNDLIAAANTLKRAVVTRANNFCQANGSDAAGTCTPGLFWVRGSGVFPRFTDGPCVTADPACFLNLDLSVAALRASGLPPAANLPAPPENRGPFTPGLETEPFVRTLNVTDQARLQQALGDITHRAAELPTEKTLRLTTSLTGGSHTYGTLAEPKVTFVEVGASILDLSGGAVVNGVGVLIAPQVIRLGNATLNWHGIVLITGTGDLRVENPAACGQIVGAVVIRDDATLDRKLDLDLVERGAGCAPFAVNYSCEAVTRALMLLMQTVSWTEEFNA